MVLGNSCFPRLELVKFLFSERDGSIFFLLLEFVLDFWDCELRDLGLRGNKAHGFKLIKFGNAWREFERRNLYLSLRLFFCKAFNSGLHTLNGGLNLGHGLNNKLLEVVTNSLLREDRTLAAAEFFRRGFGHRVDC